MPVIPKLTTPAATSTFKCLRCGVEKSEAAFAKTHSEIYPNGRIPFCNSCVNRELKRHDFSWEVVDKYCQITDIPFIPREFERIKENSDIDQVWSIYSKAFETLDYVGFGWKYYNDQFIKLRQAGLAETEMPELREARLKELRKRWGANYSEEDLDYLEDLYKGLLTGQNISGGLQIDQARKLCKISLVIDNKIRAEDKEVDKFFGSYDKLVKIANFTPKNAKNAVDFDSFGEVALWLEKRGHQNKFYDRVTRDIVDETMKNIESWNQRLYINEGSIGEEINARIEALNHITEMETAYDTQPDFDAERYSDEAIIFGDEDDEFSPGGEE